MHLADLPHSLLVLRCDQTDTAWVTLQLFLVSLNHAADLRVLPLGWVFLSKKCPLFFAICLLHLLVLLFKSVELACQLADSFTLARVVLEKFRVTI